jgi:hypothetical protein
VNRPPAGRAYSRSHHERFEKMAAWRKQRDSERLYFNETERVERAIEGGRYDHTYQREEQT